MTVKKNNKLKASFSISDWTEMEVASIEAGYSSLADYMKYLHKLNKKPDIRTPRLDLSQSVTCKKSFSTKYGNVYEGDSLAFLNKKNNEKAFDLIVTSPPFGLIRKKKYGNQSSEAYCEWFRPFAEGFRRVLKDQGSLVIDLGGAWNKGLPTRSLYHFELLIMLCKEYGFHLCQEFYWWNPAKLPTPVEWVNRRRVRVKDAVNCVWWLSQSPYPKANNKRILAPYSDAMKSLIKNGSPSAKLRPSGHVISNKFDVDNGGSVPPNLLAIANTESNGAYSEYCRKNNIEIHPARFPALLPEFFIRFLTDKGDKVLDPFAGSCVTGMVAESLNRKWSCVELNSNYIEGARGRFNRDSRSSEKIRPVYSISAPCGLITDEDNNLLDLKGGRV